MPYANGESIATETHGDEELEPPLSRIVSTDPAPTEYAITGAGPDMLVSHGAAGGYDQALLLGRVLSGFRLIAPSRFGYLRTPLPTDATPQAQADAYAALLDVLRIEQAVVLGASAGGPAALSFALRYPRRCRALVLVSAVSLPYPFRRSTDLLLKLLPKVERLYKRLESSVTTWRFRTNGLSTAARARLEAHDPEALALLRDLLRLTPVAPRCRGTANDLIQLAHLQHLPLADIAVPTLVIHDIDDPVVPFAHGQWIAAQVRKARLFKTRAGGHLSFIAQRRLTVPALRSFLSEAVEKREHGVHGGKKEYTEK